mmetsp:Transcript_16995/g.24669  ORF Transcript_16995/g.24669 Transcript_16995/m.24669 type:complete len:328 (+) Transcript_16995:1266-2249(+)
MSPSAPWSGRMMEITSALKSRAIPSLVRRSTTTLSSSASMSQAYPWKCSTSRMPSWPLPGSPAAVALPWSTPKTPAAPRSTSPSMTCSKRQNPLKTKRKCLPTTPMKKLQNSTNLRHCRAGSATASSGHQLVLTSSLPPLVKAPAAHLTFTTVITKHSYKKNITVPCKCSGPPLAAPSPPLSPNPLEEDTSNSQWTMDTPSGLSRANKSIKRPLKHFINCNGVPVKNCCQKKNAPKLLKILKSMKNNLIKRIENVQGLGILKRPKGSVLCVLLIENVWRLFMNLGGVRRRLGWISWVDMIRRMKVIMCIMRLLLKPFYLPRRMLFIS